MGFRIVRGAKHEYTDEATKKPYFSISQVLRVIEDPYEGMPADVRGRVQKRGKAVHLLWALLLGHHAGLLPRPSCEAAHTGYYDCIERFIKDFQPTPLRVEEPAAHPTLPYAGTPDTLLLLTEETLVEVKSGEPHRIHHVQVEAQVHLTGYTTARKRMLLYLHEDGSPATQKPVPPNPGNWACFQNALSVLQWRANGG